MEDLDLLADVFALADDETPLSTEFQLKGAKFAMLKTMVWSHAGPGTTAAMQTAAHLLRQHGAEVEEIELPPEFDQAPAWHRAVLHSEGRVSFLADYRTDKDKLDQFLVDHVENKHAVTRRQQLDAWDGLAGLRPKIDEIARRYDALVTPSVPDEAPVGQASTGSAVFNSIWTVSFAFLFCCSCLRPGKSRHHCLISRAGESGISVISERSKS